MYVLTTGQRLRMLTPYLDYRIGMQIGGNSYNLHQNDLLKHSKRRDEVCACYEAVRYFERIDKVDELCKQKDFTPLYHGVVGALVMDNLELAREYLGKMIDRDPGFAEPSYSRDGLDPLVEEKIVADCYLNDLFRGFWRD